MPKMVLLKIRQGCIFMPLLSLSFNVVFIVVKIFEDKSNIADYNIKFIGEIKLKDRWARITQQIRALFFN